MMLPHGTFVRRIKPDTSEDSLSLEGFRGIIEIDSDYCEGFILLDQGAIVAASFNNHSTFFKGKDAVNHIDSLPPGYWIKTELSLRSYEKSEFQEATALTCKNGLNIPEKQQTVVTPDGRISGELFGINILLRQPGVIAVLAFDEGFAVYSSGNADYEQLAAFSEDLIRAGLRVVNEIKTGKLEQIILESEFAKLIIVPYKDLHIAILTKQEANLGLIRIILENMQKGKD